MNSATGSGLGSGISSDKLLGTFLRVNRESFASGCEVVFVDVESCELGDFHPLGGEGGGADAGEGIEEVFRLFLAVDADALLDEGDGEGGGVGAVLVTGFDGVVGDEPVISAAAFILASGVAPAGDV